MPASSMQTVPLYRACVLLALALVLSLSSARAELEIRMDGKGERAAFFLKDTETGDFLGTFWSPFTGESDYGFFAAEGAQPEFVWSPDREHVAATGGKKQSPRVFVYHATREGLDPVEMEKLPAEVRKGRTITGLDWQSPGVLQVALGRHPETTDRIVTYEFQGSSLRLVSVEEANGKTATKEPEQKSLTAESLAGDHAVEGTNPDGGNYAGTVRIRPKNGLVLLEWDVNGGKSYGTGLLEGSSLGVALQSGVALYSIRPGTDGGWVLDGVWAPEGATAIGSETILAGTRSASEARVELPEVDGRFTSIVEGGEMEPLSISGDGPLKAMKLGTQRAEGLALGSGLAMITTQGLAVYGVSEDADGRETISGHFVSGDGRISPAVLLREQ